MFETLLKSLVKPKRNMVDYLGFFLRGIFSICFTSTLIDI